MVNFTKISGGIQKAYASAGFECSDSRWSYQENYLALEQLKPSSNPGGQAVLTRGRFNGKSGHGFKAGQPMLAFKSFDIVA